LPLISFEAHVKSNMGPQQATEFTWGGVSRSYDPSDLTLACSYFVQWCAFFLIISALDSPGCQLHFYLYMSLSICVSSLSIVRYSAIGSLLLTLLTWASLKSCIISHVLISLSRISICATDVINR
jgi:hypothetical protein